jgi:hypothetical protein
VFEISLVGVPVESLPLLFEQDPFPSPTPEHEGFYVMFRGFYDLVCDLRKRKKSMVLGRDV